MEKNTPEIENTVVSTRITKKMHKALLKLLALGSHVTVSDYLRDILREDLHDKGFLVTERSTHE